MTQPQHRTMDLSNVMTTSVYSLPSQQPPSAASQPLQPSPPQQPPPPPSQPQQQLQQLQQQQQQQQQQQPQQAQQVQLAQQAQQQQQQQPPPPSQQQQPIEPRPRQDEYQQRTYTAIQPAPPQRREDEHNHRDEQEQPPQHPNNLRSHADYGQTSPPPQNPSQINTSASTPTIIRPSPSRPTLNGASGVFSLSTSSSITRHSPTSPSAPQAPLVTKSYPNIQPAPTSPIPPQLHPSTSTSSQSSHHGPLSAHPQPSPTRSTSTISARAPMPPLPPRDVNAETLSDGYVQFILANDSEYDPNDQNAILYLQRKFAAVPKTGDVVFTSWELFELVKQLNRQEIKNWSQLVGHLGVNDVSSRPQFAQRVKRWMQKYKIDCYFDYLLGNPYDYSADSNRFSGCLMMGNQKRRYISGGSVGGPPSAGSAGDGTTRGRGRKRAAAPAETDLARPGRGRRGRKPKKEIEAEEGAEEEDAEEGEEEEGEEGEEKESEAEEQSEEGEGSDEGDEIDGEAADDDTEMKESSPELDEEDSHARKRQKRRRRVVKRRGGKGAKRRRGDGVEQSEDGETEEEEGPDQSSEDDSGAENGETRMKQEDDDDLRLKTKKPSPAEDEDEEDELSSSSSAEAQVTPRRTGSRSSGNHESPKSRGRNGLNGDAAAMGPHTGGPFRSYNSPHDQQRPTPERMFIFESYPFAHKQLVSGPPNAPSTTAFAGPNDQHYNGPHHHHHDSERDREFRDMRPPTTFVDQGAADRQFINYTDTSLNRRNSSAGIHTKRGSAPLVINHHHTSGMLNTYEHHRTSNTLLTPTPTSNARRSRTPTITANGTPAMRTANSTTPPHSSNSPPSTRDTQSQPPGSPTSGDQAHGHYPPHMPSQTPRYAFHHHHRSSAPPFGARVAPNSSPLSSPDVDPHVPSTLRRLQYHADESSSMRAELEMMHTAKQALKEKIDVMTAEARTSEKRIEGLLDALRRKDDELAGFRRFHTQVLDLCLVGPNPNKKGKDMGGGGGGGSNTKREREWS